jgi:hypothetical protein
MTISVRIGLAALALAASWTSTASDFDGSRMIICAPVEAMDCTPGAVCQRGIPNDIGAPAFIRIDFAKKIVIGPRRNTPITSFEKSESQVLLQGNELGYGWSIAVDQEGGQMSATLTNREGAFVLFGSCTPL